MPVPRPQSGESEADFVQRCVSAIGGEYDDKTQAVAICHSTYKESTKATAPPPKPDVETRNEYLERCLEVIDDSYGTREERVVLCDATWNDAKKQMKPINEKLIEALSGRDGRIRTADFYVKQVVRCVDGNCQVLFGQEAADVILKDATSRLTYSADDLLIEKDVKFSSFESLLPKDSTAKFPAGTLLGFRNIVTSDQEDRDGDILKTDGAMMDPAAPLLWQHIHACPLGKTVAIVEHSPKVLRVATALLDLNALTADAAKLIEAKAQRISHGFRVFEYDERKDADGRLMDGFVVLKFEIMEQSLVSVPSNTGAIIELYSRGKLESDLAKMWAKSYYDSRPVQVAVQREFFTTNTGRRGEILIDGEKQPVICAFETDESRRLIEAFENKAAGVRKDSPVLRAAAEPAVSQEASEEPVVEQQELRKRLSDEERQELIEQIKQEYASGKIGSPVSPAKALEILLAKGDADELRRAKNAIQAVLGAEESESDGERYRELVCSF